MVFVLGSDLSSVRQSRHVNVTCSGVRLASLLLDLRCRHQVLVCVHVVGFHGNYLLRRSVITRFTGTTALSLVVEPNFSREEYQPSGKGGSSWPRSGGRSTSPSPGHT